MWPTLAEIHAAGGALPVRTWGLLITIAFLVAVGVAQTRTQKTGIDGDKMAGIYVVAFVAGLLGARLLHFCMAEPGRFFADPLVFFKFWEGGFAFYGGAVLAAILAMIVARRNGMDSWKLADLLSAPLMLGLAIGRIGCFFAGCCHGSAVALPPGSIGILPHGFTGGQLWLSSSPPFLIEEFHHSVGMNDTPMYPTHLWECAGAFLLFLLLSWRWRHRRYDGQVFVWLLLSYPILRSTIERFRGDTIRGVDWFGLFSTSQLISIPVLVTGLVVWLWRRKKGIALVDVSVAEPGDEETEEA
jgi:phosphatidylglycerol---prolipoprotein diacylglyceryl transferase